MKIVIWEKESYTKIVIVHRITIRRDQIVMVRHQDRGG